VKDIQTIFEQGPRPGKKGRKNESVKTRRLDTKILNKGLRRKTLEGRAQAEEGPFDLLLGNMGPQKTW